MTNGKAPLIADEIKRLLNSQSSLGFIIKLLTINDIDRSRVDDILASILATPEGNIRYRSVFFYAFLEAIKAGDYERVRRMNSYRPFGLNERLNVHSQSTPLHVAAYYGQTDIAKLFLADADLRHGLRNAAGFTPAELAAMGQAPEELIDLLAELECEAFLKRIAEHDPPEPAPAP